MEIKELPIGEIKAYKNNPRKNNLAAHTVARSIRQFGFRIPILLDKNNVIIAGHTRLKAAKILKLKTVPTIQAQDLNEAQVKALRIADNKVSENSSWDFSKLKDEFLELEDLKFDLEETGFELEEAGNILEVQDENVEDVKKVGSLLIDCPKCKHQFKKGEK